MNGFTSPRRWRNVTGLPSKWRWKKTRSAPYQPRRKNKLAYSAMNSVSRRAAECGPDAERTGIVGIDHATSETNGTEGWQTRARAAEARSVENSTRCACASMDHQPRLPALELYAFAPILSISLMREW